MLQEDARRYREYYRKILSSLSFVNMPMMVFLYIYAQEIVLFLLGDKWKGAIFFFKVFAIAGFIRPAIGTSGFVMITCGKTRRYLFVGIVNSVSIIIGIAIGLIWGAEGVASGHVIANYALTLPVAYIAFRDTPATIGLFLASILPSVICSLAMGLSLKLFSFVYPIHNGVYAVGLALPIAIATYLMAWIAMPQGISKLKEMFSDFTSMFGAPA
jgi:PST family polysaccharide transporter